MIIAFSGLDGAGKSTQIDLLKNYYSAKDKSTKIIWARGGYTPGMQWLKSLARKGGGGIVPKGGISNERTIAFEKPIVRRLWLQLSILDLIFIYGIKCRWLRLLGNKVIFDRYLEDTLIDFKLNFPKEKVSKWWSWKLMIAFIPKPDLHYLLLIPVEESQRRSILKNEPFPDSKKVLIARLEKYKSLASKSTRYIDIDCMQSIDMIHSKIISNISE